MASRYGYAVLRLWRSAAPLWRARNHGAHPSALKGDLSFAILGWVLTAKTSPMSRSASHRAAQKHHNSAGLVQRLLPLAACVALWETQPALAEKATNEEDLPVHAEELVRADNGEVVSNAHTARWRVFTYTGREMFTQRLPSSHTAICHNRDAGRKRRSILQGQLRRPSFGFGDKDPHVASSYNNLAELYRLRREYNQAEPLYLEAVQRMEAATGPQSQRCCMDVLPLADGLLLVPQPLRFKSLSCSVGLALHNLAGVYVQQRDFKKAREYYERALKVRTNLVERSLAHVAHIKGQTLGINHPEYATTLFHLGEDAGAGLSKTAVRRMSRLAEILVADGQLFRAEQHQRKVLHALEMSQGAEDLSTLTAAENLASTLLAQERYQEARDILQRCLQSREHVLGPSHYQNTPNLYKLALSLTHLGEEGESAASASLLEEAVALAATAARLAEQCLNQALQPGGGPIVAVPGREVNGLIGSHLMAVVKSLNLMGLIFTKISETQQTSEEDRLQAEENAERAFERCLDLLLQPNLPQAILRSPELKREKLVCLQRLAFVMNRRRRLEPRCSNSKEGQSGEDRVRHLLEQAMELQTDLDRM
eukprot:SM000154S01431  [mRNA]  locus=s154:312960:317693:- [translate_table: standard]